MNKLTKLLLIIAAILLFFYLILINFNKELEDMPSKIGSKLGGGELTMSEYYTLSQFLQTYKDYISKKEYKTAYNMLGSSYRNYISYEDYEKNISNKNMNNLQLEDIKIITASTFDLLTDTSGEKAHYSIIIDKETNIPKLYPESFLDYKVVDIKENRKGTTTLLKDYTVNIDKCFLNLQIKNNKNNNLKITKATLYTNLDDIVDYSDEVIVNAKDTKNISLSFDTNYAFPDKLVLNYTLENTDNNFEIVFEINE